MARTKNAISLVVTSVVVIAIIVIAGFGLYLDATLNQTTITGHHTSFTPPSSSSNTIFFNGSIETTQIYPPSTTNYSTFSASNLRLELSVNPSNESAGSVVFDVEEYNTLNTVNNVSQAKEWKYSQFMLNPYNPCGSPGPVGFAVFQGYYDQTNYTEAKALALYDDTITYLCTTTFDGQGSFYSIAPNSDQATLISEIASPYSTTLSISFTTRGYWEGGSFHNFPPGPYTVLGADEWGKIVMTHIVVSSNSSITGTSTYSDQASS